jgi:hypothetical protein
MALPPAQNRPPRELPAGAVEELLRQSAEQIDIRKKELEIQRLTSAQDHDYAKAALNAQAEDLKHQRTHEQSQLTRRFVFAGVLVLFGLLFLGFCLYSGKEQFAIELTKLVLYGGGGSVGGYWYGRARKGKSSDGPSADDGGDVPEV